MDLLAYMDMCGSMRIEHLNNSLKFLFSCKTLLLQNTTHCGIQQSVIRKLKFVVVHCKVWQKCIARWIGKNYAYTNNFEVTMSKCNNNLGRSLRIQIFSDASNTYTLELTMRKREFSQ